MSLGNIQSRSLDFYYRVLDSEQESVHAEARTALLFFDYDRQRPAKIPQRFAVILNSVIQPGDAQ